MIKTFGNAATRAIFVGESVEGLSTAIQQRALGRLQMLHAAVELTDLAAVPRIGLHVLEEKRSGFHCICVDKKGRICFRWHEGDAYDVELYGYH